MAKVKNTSISPDGLLMNLFGPGMSALHRAGLGGLACTLKYIQQAYEDDALDSDDVPGGPWASDPPWSITAHSVVLNFGQPDHAGAFLKRLFRIAFDLKDSLVYLPGQYGYRNEPTTAIRAELQQALLLTFLQHGKTRALAKEPLFVPQEIDGPVMPPIEFRQCSWYKHQDGCDQLAVNGKLAIDPIEVAGPLNPGAIVRHTAFAAATRIEQTPEQILPLYFAVVGCLSLSVNRGVGVLVIPEVTDLLKFMIIRPLMTPRAPAECRIASAGDAALQAQIRVITRGQLHARDLPGAYTMTFMPTPWAKQQKSRVAAVHVPCGEEKRLSRFADALQALCPRVKPYEAKKSQDSNKHQWMAGRTECFWADSVVRPLVADNLAANRPWYTGFARLMTAIDQNNKPVRAKISFEKKGLHAMIENKKMFDTDSEAVVIMAVHEALRNRYGRIAEENSSSVIAMKNRWDREYERWRIAFAGAKTAQQFRTALCDLFSRAGSTSTLRENWSSLLPFLTDVNWHVTRDLALLALPSYAGQGNDGDTSVTSSQEH